MKQVLALLLLLPGENGCRAAPIHCPDRRVMLDIAPFSGAASVTQSQERTNGQRRSNAYAVNRLQELGGQTDLFPEWI
jgi:hypothetical protein